VPGGLQLVESQECGGGCLFRWYFENPPAFVVVSIGDKVDCEDTRPRPATFNIG
jgi:hypothetical protein